MKFVALQWKLEPRDLWVGIYWDLTREMRGMRHLDVYICLLPMLPLRLMFQLGRFT